MCFSGGHREKSLNKSLKGRGPLEEVGMLQEYWFRNSGGFLCVSKEDLENRTEIKVAVYVGKSF